MLYHEVDDLYYPNGVTVSHDNTANFHQARNDRVTIQEHIKTSKKVSKMNLEGKRGKYLYNANNTI